MKVVFENLPNVPANAKCMSKLDTSCDSHDDPATGRHKTLHVMTGTPRAYTQNLFVTSPGWVANLAYFFFLLQNKRQSVPGYFLKQWLPQLCPQISFLCAAGYAKKRGTTMNNSLWLWGSYVEQSAEGPCISMMKLTNQWIGKGLAQELTKYC